MQRPHFFSAVSEYIADNSLGLRSGMHSIYVDTEA
jgi:hypothetical protein